MNKKIMDWKLFLFSLTAAWCIGISMRFLLMGNDTYKLNLWDTFFDWGIMLTLGIILLVYSAYLVYKKLEKEPRRK